jgi:(2Fe-2S) ferredoxin
MTDFRCSTEARRRQDPLVGTAPPARRWLLLEQDGGWAPQAFDGMQLDAAVRSDLAEAAEATGARIMLIRRPGRRASRVCLERAWCVVDGAAEAAVTWGTWSYDTDLHAAADRLRAVGAATTDVATASPGRLRAPGPEPDLLLVCTHGRKDVCCAVRGRPVAADLAERWPEATWECSHTGGDRFAANVVVLPDGVIYGGLDPASAVEAVAAHHAGTPLTAHLRGVTGHPPAVQAALVAVHDQCGPLPWGAVQPREVHTRGATHRVVLTTGTATLEVSVTERVTEPHQLTCSAVTPGRASVPVAGPVRTIAR